MAHEAPRCHCCRLPGAPAPPRCTPAHILLGCTEATHVSARAPLLDALAALPAPMRAWLDTDPTVAGEDKRVAFLLDGDAGWDALQAKFGTPMDDHFFRLQDAVIRMLEAVRYFHDEYLRATYILRRSRAPGAAPPPAAAAGAAAAADVHAPMEFDNDNDAAQPAAGPPVGVEDEGDEEERLLEDVAAELLAGLPEGALSKAECVAILATERTPAAEARLSAIAAALPDVDEGEILVAVELLRHRLDLEETGVVAAAATAAAAAAAALAPVVDLYDDDQMDAAAGSGHGRAGLEHGDDGE